MGPPEVFPMFPRWQLRSEKRLDDLQRRGLLR